MLILLRFTVVLMSRAESLVRYTPVYFYTPSNTLPVLELHGTPQLSRVRSVCTRPTSYLPEKAKTEGFKMYRTTVCQPGPAAGELSGPQDPVPGAGDGACCPLSKNPYQLSVIRASLPHLSIFSGTSQFRFSKNMPHFSRPVWRSACTMCS